MIITAGGPVMARIEPGHYVELNIYTDAEVRYKPHITGNRTLSP
jgi:hypothetical protein